MRLWADIAGTLTIVASATGGGVFNLPLGQLQFPATQNPSSNANTLDDYEEGTTSPTPTSGSGSFTSVNGVIYYTKIGKVVTLNGQIGVTTNGTAATSILIAVPFTALSQSGNNYAVGNYYNRSTGASGGRVTIADSSATATLVTDVGGYPTVADGQVLNFSVVYLASA